LPSFTKSRHVDGSTSKKETTRNEKWFYVVGRKAVTQVFTVLCAASLSSNAETFTVAGSPLVTNAFTADPAALVYNDAVYLYTGHDEAKGREMFTMWDWLCFSSKDMKTWTAHGPIMRVTDFKWATRDAWASQAIERNGKFYFYAAVRSGR
jgi:hypothetical protein